MLESVWEIISNEKSIDLKLVRSDLQQCLENELDFFDRLSQWEIIGGFSISYNITKDIAMQRRDLIVDNNLNNRKSMIERSCEELQASEDNVVFMYGDILISAIRLQKQEGIWWPESESIFQRTSHIVHRDFRRKEWFDPKISSFMIGLINERNADKNIYWITSSDSVVESNRVPWSIALPVRKLESSRPDVYLYVVWARNWEDFKDMLPWEEKSTYTFLANSQLSKYLAQNPGEFCKLPIPEPHALQE